MYHISNKMIYIGVQHVLWKHLTNKPFSSSRTALSISSCSSVYCYINYYIFLHYSFSVYVEIKLWIKIQKLSKLQQFRYAKWATVCKRKVMSKRKQILRIFHHLLLLLRKASPVTGIVIRRTRKLENEEKQVFCKKYCYKDLMNLCARKMAW